MKKITFDEMWKKLEKYLTVDKALEQGFSNGKYTAVLAKYAKQVVGIDIDENFLKIAEENLKDYNNIELLLMDSKKMTFPDKSFDVILNTSFHEFDLSHGTFSMNLDLKKKGYKLVETGLTFNDDGFDSREELEEAMLDWWADIKIPANDEEKKEMISQIDKILEEAGMLQDLHVIEDVRYTIFQRSN